VVILLFDARSNLLEVAGFAGLGTGTIESVKFHLDQGVTGLAATSLKQIYVKDVTKDQRYLSYHAQIAGRGSFVASPLIVRKRLVGVLNLHKREANAFPPSELKMIQAIANQMAIATENSRLIEKARDSANFDEVTGLANRRYFQEILKREVAQARRFNSSFSVVMCTIDNFELFVEKHGRAQGDALLHRVGTLLANNTRGIDLVCRFGNQDFAILLPKTFKDGGIAASEKLRQFMTAENFSAFVQELPDQRLTLSFGVTEFPTDSKNIYELINLADRALLQARRDGSNRTVAWESVMTPPGK
jgi:diguanylate cyclase (GGDEF)-like protein